MERLPPHIEHALYHLDSLIPSQHEEFLRQFVQRWQGDGEEHLVRAANEYDGDDLDRWFALWALGALGTVAARKTLLTFLASSDSDERMISAYGLAKMRDQAALPVLMECLQRFVVPPGGPIEDDDSQYFYWLLPIVSMLGKLGQSRATPLLRQALQWAVRAERAASEREPGNPDVQGVFARLHPRVMYWRVVQETIVFALGRLNASGVLTGLLRIEDYLDGWRVHLIMGHLHDQYQFTSMLRWQEMPGLAADVERLLEQWFGLGEDERDRCMRQYEEQTLFALPASEYLE